jgi:pimeloyl-ACP methyl ester carboxylesterase
MPEQPTFVLVHGAWGGGWMWWKLVPELEKRGYAAVTLDLPTSDAPDTSTGLLDDAQAVRNAIDAVNGPVILVGNSYGGPVITAASVDAPNVTHLVYVAAFMPDAGEPVLPFMSENSTPEFGEGVGLLTDGRLTMDHSTDVRLALQQSTPDDHEVFREKIATTMSFGSDFTLSLPKVGWREHPSTYIVCTEDRSCRPESQMTWAKTRATNYVEVPFDHCPQVSHPAELAEILTNL